MNFYVALKITHVVAVLISISLFTYRFALLARHPERPLTKTLKVLPHVNDTVLLAAAFGMLGLSRVNPFVVPWLTAKLIALLLYILLGAICLKSAPGSRRQIVFFVLAMAAFAYIVLVALGKQAMPIGF